MEEAKKIVKTGLGFPMAIVLSIAIPFVCALIICIAPLIFCGWFLDWLFKPFRKKAKKSEKKHPAIYNSFVNNYPFEKLKEEKK